MARARQPRNSNLPTHSGAHMTLEKYEGPLPPSAELERYEAIMPGLADRIVKMAEDQLAHRQALEVRAVNAGIRHASTGQVIAGIIAVSGLGAATAVGIWGSPITGFGIAIADIAGLAGVFLVGSKNQRDERKQRAEMMARYRSGR